MSDAFNQPGAAAPSPLPASSPSVTSRRSSGGLAGWVMAVIVVLILAVAGGLFTAWVVANMRAVPAPVAFASPTPAQHASSCLGCASPSAPAASSTPGPRFTPTPTPTVELTPPPFTYVVGPGDKLVNIAAMFQVDVQDIINLNNISNPNKIFVGEQLLIPGYGVQPTPKPHKTPKPT
ncbi:MAG TPA: LysM domain-containing protein [Candidatus Limnocylindrales bacterium]